MSHGLASHARSPRLWLGCSATALAAALAVAPAAAQSFQGSATVAFGSVNITNGTNTTNIDVASPSAVVDWTPSDTAIGTGTSIAFQPAGTTATYTGTAGNFAILNRIIPADTTRAVQFDGALLSQIASSSGLVRGGTVFFYSPGGIVLGPNAVFDVGNLGLTTAPPVVDSSGGWYTDNTVQFGAASSASAVHFSSGSRITASQTGSYVAAFAPAIRHMGAITTNGQAALVAGEAGTITFSPDGLFDIEVSVGTNGDESDTALFVSGTIDGSASTGGEDLHRAYLVAVPKNEAIFLSIQRGASLGFDIAGAADLDGNVVVLSAGYNIDNGTTSLADAGGGGTGTVVINDGSSGLSGGGIDFTSRVHSSASGDSLVDVFRQTRFASDVYLAAQGTSRVQVNTNSDSGGFTPGTGMGSAVLPGFNASAFPPVDDTFLPADLGFTANFFGNSYSSTFVSSNGYLTFGSGSASFTPTGLGEDYSGLPIIAAFFADIDTRGAGDNDITFGPGMFGGRPAFGANWPGVGYFSARTDKLNNFQIVLVDRADTGVGNFDIMLNYNSIQWETSGSGFGGNSAAVGYNAGTGNAPGTFFEFPGSRMPGSFLDGGPLSLAANSNIGEAGRYLFTVRNGDVAPARSAGVLTVGGNLSVSSARSSGAGLASDAGTAQVNLAGGIATIGGRLEVNADSNLDRSGDGVVTGGSALVTLSDGASLTVGGDLIATASGLTLALDAQGGSAQLTVEDASTATVGGVTRVLGYGSAGRNNGTLGAGGDGRGGVVNLAVTGGSAFTTRELNVAADGVGGLDVGSGGGTGTGGAATIRVEGEESSLTVLSPNVTGDAAFGARDLLSAEGIGGATATAGGTGGEARGGIAALTATTGGSIVLPSSTGALALVLARAFGGSASGANSTAGRGIGGAVTINVDAASLTGEGILPSSYGQGGSSTAGAGVLVNGGDGLGGTRAIAFVNGATFTGSTGGGCPCGLGGSGTGGGRGGNASGGVATTIFDASTANVSARGFNTFISNTGGGGARDGNATGGAIAVAIRNGAVVDLADGAVFAADASVTTNLADGTSATDGNATGGVATLTVDNSRITGNGTLSIAANGAAGVDSEAVGSGRGGAALFVTTGTTTIDVASLTVSANGTTGGAPGEAGTATANISGTTINAETLTIGNAGTGGSSSLQLASSALTSETISLGGGGSALLDLAGGSIAATTFIVAAPTMVLPGAAPTSPGTITAPNLIFAIPSSGSIRSYANFVTTGDKALAAQDIVLGGFRTTGVLGLVALGGQLTVGDTDAASILLSAPGAVQAGTARTPGFFTASSSGASVAVAGVTAAETLLSAQTDVTAGAITASTIGVMAGGIARVQGAWTASGIAIESADIAISESGGLVATETIDLLSTNPTQTIVGDATGTGWVLGNAEFSRLRAPEINIVANGEASSPVTLLVGDLTVRGFQAGSSANLTAEDGVLNLFASAPTGELAGTAKVVGTLRGTGFTAENSIDFDADVFQLDAVNGLAELLDSSGQLSGVLELEANRIWVAAPEILGRLEANPSYEGRIDDINTPLAVSRPDGVLRALVIDIEEGPPVQVLVQNTGTRRLPAGFLASSDGPFGEDFEGTIAPGSIELAINGQLIVEGRTLTGAEVGEQLLSDENRAAFSASSTVNDCSVEGRCVSQDLASSSTISSEIELLGSQSLAEEPFATEDASEEEEQEAEKSASAPIEPPVVLIDTRPLNPPLDIVDPVSGSGNPAALALEPDAAGTGDDQ